MDLCWFDDTACVAANLKTIDAWKICTHSEHSSNVHDAMSEEHISFLRRFFTAIT